MWRRLASYLNGLRFVLWVFLLALAGAAVWLAVNARLSQDAANLKSLEAAEKISFPVTTTVLEPGPWESWRSYYGQAKAVHTQDVTTFEREIVRAVHVQVGDHVKKGQTVVSLLAADRTARAQASRTGYDEALLNYKRLDELRKKGGVSQAEVDKAYAALKSVEAGLRSSQSTLLRTELKASIDGIVSARNVEPGEVAEMGKPLVSIVDPSEMEAQLMVSKKDIFNINKQTSVDIYVDGTRSVGWVKRVSPEAQSGSGLYPVVVGLKPDAGVLPGTYVEGRFLVEKKNDVIVIPSDIVIYRGNAQSVYVASGDVARSVTITTGSGRGGRVVVTSGLSAGDELIVSGNRSLYDGVPVSKNLDFGEDRPL